MGFSIIGEKVKPGSSLDWSREDFERRVSLMFLTAVRTSAPADQTKPLMPSPAQASAPQSIEVRGRIGPGLTKL